MATTRSRSYGFLSLSALFLWLSITFLLFQFLTVTRLWGITNDVATRTQVDSMDSWQQHSVESRSQHPDREKRSFPDDMLQLALEEKEKRKHISDSDVLVLSPLGNSTASQRRQDYRQGRDDTFTLECSLHMHYYQPLIRATFDDSQGYNSLDIRKVQVIYNALRHLLHNKNHSNTTLIVVVDTFDVLFQKTPNELAQEYDQQPYPIVVGGELTCWDPVSGAVHSNVSTPFCSLPVEQRALASTTANSTPYYLNSGVYMSTLGTLLRFLQYTLLAQHLPTANDGLVPWPNTTNQFNDQAYWSFWYVKYHPLIGLDDANKLSLVANIGKARRPRTKFVDGKFVVHQKTPAIVHFPGQGAKDFRVYQRGKQYYRELCSGRERGVDSM